MANEELKEKLKQKTVVVNDLQAALKRSDALLIKSRAWDRFARPGAWVSWAMLIGALLVGEYDAMFAAKLAVTACMIGALYVVTLGVSVFYVISATRVLARAKKKHGLD